jgi:cell division protein DivIC
VIKVAKVKKKKKVLKTNAIRATLVVPTCLILIALVIYTTVNYSLDIYGKYKEKEKYEQELTKLKEKEQKLMVDVEKLQDPEYVGRYLREKFLYSKKGEYIIKLPQEERD